MGLALNDARTGDEEEGAGTYMHRPDFKRVAHEGDFTLPDVADAAVTLVRREFLSVGA